MAGLDRFPWTPDRLGERSLQRLSGRFELPSQFLRRTAQLGRPGHTNRYSTCPRWVSEACAPFGPSLSWTGKLGLAAAARRSWLCVVSNLSSWRSGIRNLPSRSRRSTHAAAGFGLRPRLHVAVACSSAARASISSGVASPWRPPPVAAAPKRLEPRKSVRPPRQGPQAAHRPGGHRIACRPRRRHFFLQ